MIRLFWCLCIELSCGRDHAGNPILLAIKAVGAVRCSCSPPGQAHLLGEAAAAGILDTD